VENADDGLSVHGRGERRDPDQLSQSRDPAAVDLAARRAAVADIYHLGNTGLFAQYMIEPAPRWVFSGGGRYDRLALDNLRAGGTLLEQTFSAFSPKASATFKALGTEPAVRRR
jgi:outer membrane receptor protein involved in Fe transport